MKKLMLFATVIILFASCEEPTTALQYGVVEKNELCDSYGYKYKVTVTLPAPEEQQGFMLHLQAMPEVFPSTAALPENNSRSLQLKSARLNSDPSSPMYSFIFLKSQSMSFPECWSRGPSSCPQCGHTYLRSFCLMSSHI